MRYFITLFQNDERKNAGDEWGGEVDTPPSIYNVPTNLSY